MYNFSQMQTINFLIERLGVNGEGVGYHEGFTVFVPGALPGESVRVVLHEQKKTYGRGKIVEHLSVSPHRIDPACPLFGKCGGCQLMHLDYPQQLEAKRQRVIDALERIGKLSHPDVLPCIPSSLTVGYRNKIQLPSGKGLYAYNTHELVEVTHCHIHCDLGEKAYEKIRPILQRFSEGELRHLLIKTAIHKREILVTLVTKSKNPPGLPAIAKEIMDCMSEIRGVVQNVNNGAGNRILTTHFETLAGEPFILEDILGLSFKISSASFFQVNPSQAKNLYQKVLDIAALKGYETVLDAYCGVGTLSLLLAKQAKEVIGVESVSTAIEDAKENAKRNEITNAQFYCARAQEIISHLREIDVAVLNPPRKGCERSFLEGLLSIAPSRILYVSCDPATLSRDLSYLCLNGYLIELIQPFDMFPQTAHVECLVSLVTPKI